MSFGSGHVMDMISRMKQNRVQRPSKKENSRKIIGKPFIQKKINS